ncbi:hypothetical protein ES703_83584 [subsurface metagenome]
MVVEVRWRIPIRGHRKAHAEYEAATVVRFLNVWCWIGNNKKIFRTEFRLSIKSPPYPSVCGFGSYVWISGNIRFTCATAHYMRGTDARYYSSSGKFSLSTDFACRSDFFELSDPNHVQHIVGAA